jgi:Methyltransferase domain
MRRVAGPELLDTDSGTPEEVDASLGDLWRVNRWFGGVATTQAMVERVARRVDAKAFSWLEVAAGSGDVPRKVRERLREQGTEISLTLSDRTLSHLQPQGSSNGAKLVAVDALALPFPDGSFDLVSSGLFAHHLSPEQLIRFVDESLRVCRTAVLINDLVRHPLHLALVYAGMPLYRSRLTRHDAPASVRQAYTPDEMREALGRSKAARVEILRHYLFRMGVIVWKG